MKTKKQIPTEIFLGIKKIEIQGKFDDVESPEIQENKSNNSIEVIDDHRSVSLDYTYSNDFEDQANIENWN